MAVAYFLCPYKRSLIMERARYCVMDDFTRQIRAEGGDWSESEVADNQAVVKVRASAALLSVIGATPGFTTPTRQVMETLIAAGRLKPRWDRATETIILDGPVQASKPLAVLDAEVRDRDAVRVR